MPDGKISGSDNTGGEQYPSFTLAGSNEEQGTVNTMQNARCHASIKDPGYPSPAVTGDGDEVRVFAFGSINNCFYNGAVGSECASFYTFLAKLTF